MDYAGKTFLVFGGLGGIGLETCKSLLDKGARNVGIFDIAENAELFKGLVESFPSATVRCWKVDTTQKSEIDFAFKTALSEFQTVDIIINCVGVVDESRPERCIEINLLASIHLNYAAIDYMSTSKAGKGGTVVNVASTAGLQAFPLCPVYCASKFGLVGLTRALGTDFYYNKTGIKFIGICPGFTITPLIRSSIASAIHGDRKLEGNMKTQSAEICGSLLVQALEQNKNGSLWKIYEGNLSEVIPPIYAKNADQM